MTAEVTFRHGDPVMIDYTPASGNIAVGQVVTLGSVTSNTGGTGAIACVAHHPITNNTKGAIAVGGGVYDGINRNNANVGVVVYWDDSSNWFTTTSTNNAKFGYVVENAAGGTNSTVSVFHSPDPT